MTVIKDTVKELFQLAYGDIFGAPHTSINHVEEKNNAAVTKKKIQETILPGDTVITIFNTVPGYYSPKIQIDSIVTFLPYGHECRIVDCKDDFIMVAYQKTDVWLHKDSVTKNIEIVVPDYAMPKNTSSEVSDAFTTAIRFAINDIFSMGRLGMLLQNVEYVWYRMERNNVVFPWPKSMRPRQAGRWSSILSQKNSMYVGTVPMSGVVLECYDIDNSPQIFFVEAVTPDEQILVSGIETKSGKFYHFVDFTTIITPKDETLKFICNK